MKAFAELPGRRSLYKHVLKNGLELFVVPDPTSQVLTVQTWYRVGSRDERLDPQLQATGLAHFFEHMMFRGTPRFPDGAFDKTLTEAGAADQNATTWLDRTNYYESLPLDPSRDVLELALDLESDRMQNLVVDDKLLETERGAVLGELRMGLDDPDTVGHDLLYMEAFSQHPYRYSTIGTEAEIKKFTSSHARYFYETYYSPGNATLLILGAVTPERAIELTEKYYGSVPAQRVPRFQSPLDPPSLMRKFKTFTHSQIESGKFLWGCHAPGMTDAAHPAWTILDHVLSAGEGALLEEAWVESGLAVQPSSYLGQFRDPALLILGADFMNEVGAEEAEARGKELETTLENALNHLLKSPSLDRAVTRAIAQWKLSTYSSWESLPILGEFMGEWLAAEQGPLRGFEWAKQVEQVTAQQVKAAAEALLDSRNRVVIVGVGDADR